MTTTTATTYALLVEVPEDCVAELALGNNVRVVSAAVVTDHLGHVKVIVGTQRSITTHARNVAAAEMDAICRATGYVRELPTQRRGA